MQIRMQMQAAQIAIQSRPAIQSIQQPKAILQIEQPQAAMKIRTIPGKLTIDQTQAWEEMGIRSVFRSTEEVAQKAKQTALQGVARVSREGDEMLDIQKGRDVIVEQAKRKANPPPRETTIAYVPSPFSVKINYQSSKTDIQVQTRQPIINAQSQKPVISYRPGDVQISLKQHNSLKIDFVK